jgi:flagellar basal-body rod protein FlgB
MSTINSGMINSGMIETPMMEALSRFLDVDVARNKLITANVANVDTPGFRTRDLDFRAELRRARLLEREREMGAETETENGGGIFSYASDVAYAYAPAAYTPVVRRVRGLLERPDGNNVNVERESLLLAEGQMKFNLGIQLLKDEFHTISQAINSGGGTSS